MLAAVGGMHAADNTKLCTVHHFQEYGKMMYTIAGAERNKHKDAPSPFANDSLQPESLVREGQTRHGPARTQSTGFRRGCHRLIPAHSDMRGV